MKHLLTAVAVLAVLAISAPVSAQPANPSGGNAVGLPGPNPGGPGLTPYSTGAPPSSPSGRLPGPKTSGGSYIAPPPTASATTSAMPPKHHHARASSHGKMASHHPSRFPNVQGNNSANQLNQAELARVQSGNFTPPPAPSADMTATPSDGMNRMPAGGRATSNPTGGR
jgi:hypothetical protein